MAEIGAAFGKSLQWANLECRKLGLPLRRPGSRNVKPSRVVELYAGGMAIKQIARHFKVSADPIAAILRQRGIEIRDNNKIVGSERTIMITRLFRQGLQGIEIADKLKLTRDVVWATLRKVVGSQGHGGCRKRKFKK